MEPGRLRDFTQAQRHQQAVRAVGRTLISLAHGGNAEVASAYARRRLDWADGSVIAAQLAAVGGQTASGDSSLVGTQSLDLMAAVRPLTILDRLPTRATSFSALSYMSGGTASGWAGEAKAAAVSKGAFSRLSSPLTRLKNVGFIIEDIEFVRSADPSVELTISQDLAAACAQGLDTSFIDPSSAAIAGVRPASVSFGAPAFASSGSTAANFDADLAKMIESLIARGSNLLSAYFVLHPITALFMSRLLNVAGDRAYPLLNVHGGEILGLPVLTSGSCPHIGSPPSTSIFLLDANKVWVAQDSAMELSLSQKGSVEMLDNPIGSSGTTPVATSLVSMFQTNSVAIRGGRFVNWQIAHSGFCAALNNVID